VQDAPAAIVPPEYEIDPLPGNAVNVPPAQVELAFGTLATCNPAGKLSMKLKLLASRAEAVLSIVNSSVLIPRSCIVAGVNSLEKVGAGATVTELIAGPPTTIPLAKRSDVSFVYIPGATEDGIVTETVKEHISLAPSAPLEKVSKPLPEIEAPVLQGSPGKELATNPGIIAFRSSVKERPDTGADDKFVSVNSRSIVCPATTLVLEKDFSSKTPAVERSAVAGALVYTLPSTVDDRLLVVFVYVPRAAPIGI